LSSRTKIDKISISGLNELKDISISNDGSYINIIDIKNNTVYADPYNDDIQHLNFTVNNAVLTFIPEFPLSTVCLTINCQNSKFPESSDLTYLVNLEELTCYSTNLSNLPLLPVSLKRLYCSDNKLSNLNNIQNLENLELLECANNRLTELNLGGLENLKYLNCSNNNLIDLTNFPSTLEVIECSNNKLSGELEVSDLENLKVLNCKDNKYENIRFHPNIQLIKETYDPINATTYLKGNSLPFKTLATLAGGLDNLSNWYREFLPQELIEEGGKLVNEEIDLSEQIMTGASVSWYDITDYIIEFRNENQDDYGTGYSYFLDNMSIPIFSDMTDNGNGKYTIPESARGKVLLGEISKTDEKTNYNRYGTYYLVSVDDGIDKPSLQFQVIVNGVTTNVANNTTTSISSILEEQSVELLISPIVDSSISYDSWSIDYVCNDNNNNYIHGNSGRIEGNSFSFTEIPSGQIPDYYGSFAITKLTLSNNNVPLEPFSYVGEPYIHNIVISPDIPILQYEVAINSTDDYNVRENNDTTEKDFGNKIYLRVSPTYGEPPVDLRIIENPGNSRYWQIEYTEEEGGDPILTEPIPMDEYYYFKGGNPHQNIGKYPYSISRLFIYNENIATRSSSGSYTIMEYDFTGNPYNHTIIIKSDGTNPEPDPEVSMQFAVAINNTNYSDVPNNHTTSVKNGSSVYLRISALVDNISYSSWQIDYTNPDGSSVTSDWVSANDPYVFNGGNPHTKIGTYVYTVSQLKLNDNGNIHSFSYAQASYRNTIVIKDDGENPGPDPNPDPEPGIKISTAATTCPDEENVLLPFELIYTAHPLKYTIHFSKETRAVGFIDQLNPAPLPDVNYLTIPLPSGVPAGIYKGTISLFSENTSETISDCPFEIKVLIGTEITKQPVSVEELCNEDIFTLSVEAIGENLSYQWYKDNQPIPRANSATYEAVFSKETAGSYYVQVKGLCGTENSKEAIVSGNLLYIQMKWNDVMYIDNTDNRYVSFQWYKDGSPITLNGTSIYYTNPEEGLNGVYFVRAINREGLVEESCVKVFSSTTRSSSAQLYPNPVGTNETLTVYINMV